MKLLISFISLLIFSFSLNAQSETTQHATITFINESVDYGTIDYKSNGEREFLFLNTGDEDLKIINCTGSCSCTYSKWPTEAIQPGNFGTIFVTYDTSIMGEFNRYISIESNDPSGKKTLNISGKVNAAPK